jgi:hypothetical protein
MEPEKTLLQQIREKELEYAEKIRAVKAETDAAVAEAKNEAEAMLCTADGAGTTEAEQMYWEEKAKTGADTEQLKQSAATGREHAAAEGEKNMKRAVEAITGFVIME